MSWFKNLKNSLFGEQFNVNGSQVRIKNVTRSRIVINGHEIQGNNVTIKDGNVIVDGVDLASTDKVINISVHGDVEHLVVSACNNLEVNGNATNVQTTSANVKVTGNVLGNIDTTGGDIVVAGNVSGDIDTTSGDVRCGDVGGNIDTVSGDINRK